MATRLREKAAAAFKADGIDVILTTPAITWDDEVVFSYNSNRHMGDIDTVGLNA